MAVAASHGLLAMFGVNTSISYLSRAGQPGGVIAGLICSTLVPAFLLTWLHRRAARTQATAGIENAAKPESNVLPGQNSGAGGRSVSVILGVWSSLLLVPALGAYALSADINGYPATGINIESFQNVALLQVILASALSLLVMAGEAYRKRQPQPLQKGNPL